MDIDLTQISLTTLHFERYGVLALMLMAIIFMLLEFYPGRSYFYSMQSLKKFIDKHLVKHLMQGNESRKKSWLRIFIVSVIWILLVIALANPRWDFEETKAFKPNINVVILMDISKSMDCGDLKPSRLKRAKQEVVDIIKKIDGVNIGLIAFAQHAHVVSPITDDKPAVLFLLPSISTSLVGIQGSNIEAGLKSADLLLKSMEGGVNYIIVMSDGGFETADFKDLSKQVKNAKIITYGFGTEQGAPIPDEGGKFIKDGDKVVITKLEKQNLISLSGLDNYIESSYLDDDSEKVMKIVLKDVEKITSKTKIFKIWNDRFYIPLGLAMLIILPFFRRGAIFPAIILLLISTPSYSGTFSIPKNQLEEEAAQLDNRSFLERLSSTIFKNYDQQAKDAFNNKKYDEAAEKFSNFYNKGVSMFRAGDLESAEKYFSQVSRIDTEAGYNLGNVYLLQNKIPEAVEAYEEVLKIKPAHEDAKYNLVIAKKLLKNQATHENQSKNAQGREINQQQNLQSQHQPSKDKNNPPSFSSGLKQVGGDRQNKSTEENNGNLSKLQLDIEARNIFSKITSDPGTLMKNRFRYEETKEVAEQSASNKTEKTVPKPW